MTDFDSPWKEALDAYFEACLALLFPSQHAAIDWRRGYEFLDKEFQQLLRDEDVSRLVVDKLVRVWLLNGREEWLLIHIEIQCQAETDFARRMYSYNRRIADRYNRFVVSLAVLGDDRPTWRPQRYVEEQLDCGVDFHYPVAKLLDFAVRQEELEASANPFAKVVLAHLAALATSADPAGRQNAKFALIRSLYERGFDASAVRQPFRFIDWVLELPVELDRRFRDDLARFEEERKMPYVTSVERLALEEGREQGREQGLREGILSGLELALPMKFGEAGADLLPEIRSISQVARLRAIQAALATAGTVEEFHQVVRSSQ